MDPRARNFLFMCMEWSSTYHCVCILIQSLVFIHPFSFIFVRFISSWLIPSRICSPPPPGSRPVFRPTLFFMPHCPQSLSNNVLRANWVLSLRHVMIIGNSLQAYSEALRDRHEREGGEQQAVAKTTPGGYARMEGDKGKARRKKPSEFAEKLTKEPICCDHQQEQRNGGDGQAATAAVASSSSSSLPPPPPPPSSPYVCLSSILPLLSECSIPNTHPSATVFNDMNLAQFILPVDLVGLIKEQRIAEATEARTQEKEATAAGDASATAATASPAASSSSHASCAHIGTHAVSDVIALNVDHHRATSMMTAQQRQQLQQLYRPFLTRPAPWTNAANRDGDANYDPEIITKSRS